MSDLRQDALAIWRAGVDAAAADRLVERWVTVQGDRLEIGELSVPLASIDRVCAVGGGKASGAMAAGLERALRALVPERLALEGWINVPDDCAQPLAHLYLHPSRPAGRNEPTAAAAEGSARMLEMVQRLGQRDLCIALISGGGSALLPAPVPPVTLDDKRTVTQALSAAGASIDQLNAVRRALSRIKGGGLARHCRAGRLIGLLLSDVRGDRPEVIASGPTVAAPWQGPAPLEVLDRFQLLDGSIPQHVVDVLRGAAGRGAAAPRPATPVVNIVIGNNQTAVDGAASEAQRRGYRVQRLPPEEPWVTAERAGRELAEAALQWPDPLTPVCLVWGGEPVVQLPPPERRGRGGRNQQLALAALAHLRGRIGGTWPPLILLSSGTDGEDGPTDAAGGLVDEAVDRQARRSGLDLADCLARCDAYPFLDQAGGLLRTGTTQTNVGDLRVALVAGRPMGHGGR